jgi:hypothetical protein
VSTYATFYKRAQKPFNSLLHETYECVRDDKGFRFLAEKVRELCWNHRDATRRNAAQRSATQRNAVQRNAVQCSVGGEEPTAY